MANEQTEPWPAGSSTQSLPLPLRWYKYRNKVLRFRQMGHAGDQAYWDLKNTTIITISAPMLIHLNETVFGALGTWYDVLPPTIYPISQRDQNTILQVSLSAHFLWTANSGSQTLLDWTTDGGTHYRRTFHTVVDRTDDSSVNEADLSFAILVNGTEPQVSIKARQYAGLPGMSIVGTQTTSWPALQSYALIADQGPVAPPPA
jgi:hypothetical protein